MSLSLTDIEAQLTMHAARHQSRLDGLQALSVAEEELKAVLSAAMAQLTPPKPPARWLSLLSMAGLVELEPPPLPVEEELWRHHEATLERVRALGHHLDTCRHDEALVLQDIAALEALAGELARSRGALSAQRAAAQARGADTDALDAQREALRAVEENVQVMLSLHQAVHPAMVGMVASLVALHAQSQDATAALAEQIAAYADDLASQTGATAFQTMRDGLWELSLAVDTCAVAISRDIDQLGQQLRVLDADAKRRRAARAEVDAVG